MADTENTPTRNRIYAAALVTPVAAAIVGFVAALAGTVIIVQFVDEGSGEGAALFFLLVFVGLWLVGGLAAAFGVGAWLSRRAVPGGRNRLGLAAMFAGWVPVAAVAGGAMAWFMDRAGLALIGGVAFALIVAGSLVVAVVRRDPRVALVPAVLALVFVGAAVLLEDGHRRSLYDGAPAPATGLVDREQLARTLPGWELLGYDDDPGMSWRPPHAEAIVRTDRDVEVTIHFHSRQSICDDRQDCFPLEPLSDGSPVFRSDDGATCNGLPAAVSVVVERPRGNWSVYSSSRCRNPNPPSVAELHALMSTIIPVDLDEWIRAT